ncbi:MAG: hypothetical protein ACRYF4_10270 [Janthinobacterium lividum]
MTFYYPWRTALLWIAICVGNLSLDTRRYLHHGHDRFSMVGGITWCFPLLFWVVVASTRWTFTGSALLQRRLGFTKRSVPYRSITRVEPVTAGKHREAAVIIYGNAGPVSYTERLTVQPADFVGFLAELERYAPQAAFHV